MKNLTLIQQNDTHAQMELHNELFWKNGNAEFRRCGGFSRIATVAREIRRETGGACLFVDCGDEIHGTAPAQWTDGAALVPALNTLGIDVMTPGNWEFGFGPDVLRKRVSEMNFPVIACNVEKADTGQQEFPPLLLREVAGFRIGLIGLTSPVVTERMPRKFGAGLRFSDGLEMLPVLVRTLRDQEKADLVVLVSHVGLAQDIEVVRKVEGIDVVLSGHTHDRLMSPVVVGKTILIQSGFSGSFLGRLDLAISGGRVQSFKHQLIEIGESIQEEPVVQNVVDEQLQPHRERMRQVVGETASPLHRMTVLECPMDNFITDAYRSHTGTDVAFSHGWRYGAPVIAGPVTEGDLWQMVPPNPELFTAEMTGAQIRDLLEASLHSVYAADPLRQKGGYPVRFSGMAAVVRLNNPNGARVAELEIGGFPCREDHRYTVTGAGEQDIKHAEKKTLVKVHSIDVLRSRLKAGALTPDASAGSRIIAI